MSKTVLIIGAGVAGLTAAKTAVKRGCRVILAGREPYLPYYRPRLIEVLASDISIEALFIQKPEWFKTSGIELQLSVGAQEFDMKNKRAVFTDGSSIHYDKLILACGAVANKPLLPGAREVFALRSYDDALVINRACSTTGRAFIVGGGLLGIETAYALHKRGIKVAVAERAEYLLPRQLDRSGGEFLKAQLEQIGILIYVGDEGFAVQGDLQQWTVIAASGIIPDVEFLSSSEIGSNRGILVNEAMQTSAAGVFACGDMAEFNSNIPGLTIVAAKQGEIAGISACGEQAVYREPVWSPLLKVADIAVMSVGSLETSDETIVLRSQHGSSYGVVVLSQGCVKGAALIGNTRAGVKLKAAVENQTVFSGVTTFEDLLLKI
jgi:nitrite reductase (NADH) large subunit